MNFPEQYRYQGNKNDNGAFIIKLHKPLFLFCIASNGLGWDSGRQ